MENQKPQYCLSCRFWLLDKKEMYCRRKAPTRDLQCRPNWPSTLPLMWCGDFEYAERPEIERRKSLLRPQAVATEIDGIEITP